MCAVFLLSFLLSNSPQQGVSCAALVGLFVDTGGCAGVDPCSFPTNQPSSTLAGAGTRGFDAPRELGCKRADDRIIALVAKLAVRVECMITAEMITTPSCDSCCITGETLLILCLTGGVCQFFVLQDAHELAPPYRDYTRRVCHLI